MRAIVPVMFSRLAAAATVQQGCRGAVEEVCRKNVGEKTRHVHKEGPGSDAGAV
jgi:hypothetical protein